MASGRKVTIEFLGSDRGLGRTTSDLEQRFGKLGARMNKVGQVSGRILAGGLVLAAGGAVKAGQAASDLAETQSKVAQVFGAESAAALDKFAASAATTIGQSKQSALDAAATFGVFGKSAGLAGDDLVDFSTDMTVLSSDMASFANTSPEEAIEAIGAALRGESEPIRKYGVLLDDATLRAEAMKLGLIKTTKEALTPQQKVLAAQAAILKQTSDQQGDFARTSEGMANKQRILKAQMENLGVAIGAQVVPAMTKFTEIGLQVVGWIDRNQTVTGALVATLGGLLAITWAVTKAIAVWTAITKIAAAAQIVFTNVQWALNLAMAANPIGLVVLAIVALVAILIVAYKKSETFRKIVNAAFGAVAKAAKAAVDFIGRHWKTILALLTGPVGIAVTLIARHWDKIKAGAAAVRDFVSDKFSAVKDAIINAFVKARERADAVWEAIKAGFGVVKDRLVDIASTIRTTVGNAFEAMLRPIQAVIDKIQWLIDKIKSIPTPNLPGIPGLRVASGSAGGVRTPTITRTPRASSAPGRASVGGGGTVSAIVQFVLPGGKVIEQQLIQWSRESGRPLQVSTL